MARKRNRNRRGFQQSVNKRLRKIRFSLAALFVWIGALLGGPQLANQLSNQNTTVAKLDTFSRVTMSVLQALGALAAVIELIESSMRRSSSRRRRKGISGDLAADISQTITKEANREYPPLEFADRASEDRLKTRLDIYLNRLIEAGLSTTLTPEEKLRELQRAKIRFCLIYTELQKLNEKVLAQTPASTWWRRYCSVPESVEQPASGADGNSGLPLWEEDKPTESIPDDQSP